MSSTTTSLGADERPIRTLYLVYWGAAEPIGRAGTIPTVCSLARTHHEEVTLVTFDKATDLAHPAARAEVADVLGSHSVEWLNLGYTKYPPGLSSFYDIARGVAACAQIIRRRRIEVVHARTFVGAFMGALLKQALGVRVVTHPDGFWPEERIDDGVWIEGSPQLQLARWMHWHAYRTADEIIVLSRHAAKVVAADPVVAARRTPITVLHTSVDVSRFGSRVEEHADSPPLRLLYLGSMGPRYLPEKLFDLFRAALDRDPRTRIRVVTRTAGEQLRAWARAARVPFEQLERLEATNAEVPAHLAWAEAGVFMLDNGASNFAVSSTKVGEYLAAGLPVLITRGAGDQDILLEESETGIVLDSTSPADLTVGFDRIRALARSAGVAARCRDTAVANMGLEHCASVQARIHRRLLDREETT